MVNQDNKTIDARGMMQVSRMIELSMGKSEGVMAGEPTRRLAEPSQEIAIALLKAYKTTVNKHTENKLLIDTIHARITGKAKRSGQKYTHIALDLSAATCSFKFFI